MGIVQYHQPNNNHNPIKKHVLFESVFHFVEHLCAVSIEGSSKHILLTLEGMLCRTNELLCVLYQKFFFWFIF